VISVALSILSLAGCADFQPRQNVIAHGQFFGYEDAQSSRNLSARKPDDISFNWPATIAARNLAQQGVTVPARISWTRFCNSGRLSDRTSLSGFKGWHLAAGGKDKDRRNAGKRHACARAMLAAPGQSARWVHSVRHGQSPGAIALGEGVSFGQCVTGQRS